VKKRTFILIGFIWLGLTSNAQRFQISDSLRTLARIDTNSHQEFYPSSFNWGDPHIGLLLANIDSLDQFLNAYAASNTEINQVSLQEIQQVLVHLSNQIGRLDQNSMDAFTSDTLVNLKWLYALSHPRTDFQLIDLNSRQLDSLCSYRDLDSLRLSRVEHQRDSWSTAHLLKKWDFDYLDNHWNAALGIGFFGFITQPETYFVSPDNTVESHRVGNGAHMILSADLLYQINRKDGVFLSLPIVTLTGSSDYKIGLLSSRPALGLGYSRRVGDILFYLSILTAPYDKWDKELISRIQPNEPVFEKVDLSDYPSSKHHHLMTSVGFSIPLY